MNVAGVNDVMFDIAAGKKRSSDQDGSPAWVSIGCEPLQQADAIESGKVRVGLLKQYGVRERSQGTESAADPTKPSLTGELAEGETSDVEGDHPRRRNLLEAAMGARVELIKVQGSCLRVLLLRQRGGDSMA